jgi:hypothetical protein
MEINKISLIQQITGIAETKIIKNTIVILKIIIIIIIIEEVKTVQL